jgi:hypothetical protein
MQNLISCSKAMSRTASSGPAPSSRPVDPEPLSIVKSLAKKLKLDLARYPRKSLIFTRVEAGLIRKLHERS